jgi:hypothetical protein
VLLLLVLALLIFWEFWPAAWWNPFVAAIEWRGGKVRFLTAPTLEGKVAVYLPDNITDEGVEQMTSLDRLQPVWLLFPKGSIGNRGVASLKRFGELRGLSLIGTKVDDAGLAPLEGLANLEILTLDGCAITDQGLEHLKKMPRLQIVSLYNTQVSRKGVERLQAARPGMKVTCIYTAEDD